MQPIPLSLTTTNWDALSTTVKDELGMSPTRVLDEKNLTLDNPSALLLVLENLIGESKAEHIQKHLTLSFIVKSDTETLLYINSRTELSVLTIPLPSRWDHLAIITGSLVAWIQAAFALCRSTVPLEAASLMSAIYVQLINSGLHNQFPDHRKTKGKNNTVYLERL